MVAGNIPWTEEPGGLQSTGSQRVGHGLAVEQASNRGEITNRRQTRGQAARPESAGTLASAAGEYQPGRAGRPGRGSW